jgi:hypothetical protein
MAMALPSHGLAAFGPKHALRWEELLDARELLEPIDHDIVNVHCPSPVTAGRKDDANTIDLIGAQESEVHLEPFVGGNVAEERDDVIFYGARGTPCVDK